MENIPYIGVSGISNRQEAKKLASIQRTIFDSKSSTVIPMTGYLLSLRSFTTETRPQYPSLSDLPILTNISSDAAFTTVHYTTTEPETLGEQLSEILERTETHRSGSIHGIQLNLSWPDPAVIERMKLEYPTMKVIFQLGPAIMRSETPENVGVKLEEYRGNLEYVLIDSSGGHGLEIHPSEVTEYVKVVNEKLSNATIIFAGGLSAGNVSQKIKELRRTTGEKFGVDAQKMLRTDDGDTLDIKKVESYLFEAKQVLEAYL